MHHVQSVLRKRSLGVRAAQQGQEYLVDKAFGCVKNAYRKATRYDQANGSYLECI